jgi:hypothetical protein
VFLNNSSCAISNIKEVCSLELEYLMISCRPYILPREFIYINRSHLFSTTKLMLALRRPSTSCIGPEVNKKILTQKRCSKWMVTDAGKLKSVLPNFYQHVTCATRGIKNLKITFTPHTEMHTKLSLVLHLANLTITLSS